MIGQKTWITSVWTSSDRENILGQEDIVSRKFKMLHNQAFRYLYGPSIIISVVKSRN
jgi:hypothetical protein